MAAKRGYRDAEQGRAQERLRAGAELAGFAKALGHPARVEIVRFLLARDSCMCGDLVDHLPLAQSTVSQHLRILKEAGLIQGAIDGPRVCYCVAPRALARFQGLVADLRPGPGLADRECEA